MIHYLGTAFACVYSRRSTTASSRTVIEPGSRPKQKRVKRFGKPTKDDKAIVAAIVMQTPQAVTERQVTGMALALNRSREMIKRLVGDARADLAANAGMYVAAHREATEKALADGSVAGLEVAAKASQWAMEKIAAEGVRVIDRDKQESTGTRVMVGIKLGGANDQPTVSALEVKE